MGVGAGICMYDVVVKRLKFAISEFLVKCLRHETLQAVVTV